MHTPHQIYYVQINAGSNGALSRRLPTEAARDKSYEICDGQSGTGAGSPSTSVSLAKHSTYCFILTINRHHNRQFSGFNNSGAATTRAQEMKTNINRLKTSVDLLCK
jgi:hypothetical protein